MLLPRFLFVLASIAVVAGLVAGVAERKRVTACERGNRDAPLASPVRSAQVAVVDVAHAVDAAALSQLVRLAPDERVIAVDDRPVANDLAAGAAIAARRLDAGTYLDLTVGSGRGRRRVLVLLH